MTMDLRNIYQNDSGKENRKEKAMMTKCQYDHGGKSTKFV